MSKRLIAGVLTAAAALTVGPMTSPASACFNTLNSIADLDCSTTCPSPTKPRAAVYVDGHWVVVCY